MRARNSGTFLLRVDPGLHRDLKRASSERNLSLNEFCQTELLASLKNQGAKVIEELANTDLHQAIESEYADTSPLGLVLFGSAARGELTTSSDIDLMIVQKGPVTRGLYGRWDDSEAIQEAIRGSSHPVNPQFVQLPSQPDEAGSLWFETAIEGRILWDPQLSVHAFLLKIRHAILDGRFQRRMSHGHPYWIKKKVG